MSRRVEFASAGVVAGHAGVVGVVVSSGQRVGMVGPEDPLGVVDELGEEVTGACVVAGRADLVGVVAATGERVGVVGAEQALSLVEDTSHARQLVRPMAGEAAEERRLGLDRQAQRVSSSPRLPARSSSINRLRYAPSSSPVAPRHPCAMSARASSSSRSPCAAGVMAASSPTCTVA